MFIDKVLGFQCFQEDDDTPIELITVFYIADKSVLGVDKPE